MGSTSGLVKIFHWNWALNMVILPRGHGASRPSNHIFSATTLQPRSSVHKQIKSSQANAGYSLEAPDSARSADGEGATDAHLPNRSIGSLEDGTRHVIRLGTKAHGPKTLLGCVNIESGTIDQGRLLCAVSENDLVPASA